MIMNMPTIKDSSSIEEVLQYIVACYGAEIYQEKQRLSNLIADLYTGEERLKRLYRRMVMEDAVSQQLYAIFLKPIQEREGFYNRLVFQFKEANFYEEAFARQVLDVFLHGMNLLLVEPISTIATEEDREWVDEYGVKYSADRKKLIDAPESLYGNYRVLDSTIVICDNAFWFCENLQEITLPSSVTSIGDDAFCGWNLQEINVAESSKFYRDIDGVLYTKDLKAIICYPAGKKDEKFVIPSSVTSIGDGTFYQCKNLREIILPSSVTSIGNEVFWECVNLEEITLPSGVTNIGDDVFWVCRSLETIILPSSVTSIGRRAFTDCSNLREINIAESNKVYRAIDGVLYTKDLKTIIRYPVGKEDKKFVIPSGITSIGDEAFYQCKSLKNITLPPSVTSIGKGAFWVCRSLETIILPSSVTSIGYGAFSCCRNLREITLSSNITSIGDYIFYDCHNLQRINIPVGTLEKFKKLLPDEAHLLHEI